MPLKYRNKPQIVDGKRFASKREAAAYVKLKALEASGKIFNLRCQVRYPLSVNGMLVATYIADFCWREVDGFGNPVGNEVVADAKGMRTPIYKLKKKLVRAIYGIEIVEL